MKHCNNDKLCETAFKGIIDKSSYVQLKPTFQETTFTETFSSVPL